jgi:FkbM family methyltransferase
MPSFRTLTSTLKATSSHHNVLLLRLGARRKSITFRNGCKTRITWPQFVILRDCYGAMQRFSFEQVDEDLFRIGNGESEVCCPSGMISTMCDLLQKYHIEQVADDEYRIKSDHIELVGSSDMLNCVREQEGGEYDCDCSGKIVLDVGGFQGESAVLFSKLGAKKVIIYEPVSLHLKYIKENVSLNNVNAEIHVEGIGDKDSAVVVKCVGINAGFGLFEGQMEVNIKVRNVIEVIEKSRADIAKIDCEGAEKCLLGVPSSTLRRIGFYMVETHNPVVGRQLREKFEASGFKLMKESKKTPTVSVMFFERQAPCSELFF